METAPFTPDSKDPLVYKECSSDLQLTVLVSRPTDVLLWFSLSSTLFPGSAGREKELTNPLLFGARRVACNVQRCEIGQGLNLFSRRCEQNLPQIMQLTVYIKFQGLKTAPAL